MLYRKEEVKEEKIGKECIVLDYATPKGFGFSKHKPIGRYPESGMCRNLICYEFNFVLSGSVVVVLDDEKFLARKDDAYDILPMKWHYLEADHVELLTITVPNWFKSQFQVSKKRNVVSDEFFS